MALCRVCTVYIVDLFFNLDFALNYVASNGLEIALFCKILPPQCERASGGPANANNPKSSRSQMFSK